MKTSSMDTQVIAGELVLRGILILTSMATKYIPNVEKPVQWPMWHRHNFPKTAHVKVSGHMLNVLVPLFYVATAALLTISISLVYSQKNNRQRGISLRRVLISENLKLFLADSLVYYLTEITTDIVKAMVGRPRPDFLARCKPVGFDPNFPNFELVPPLPICTGTAKDIWDGRRSMPSGHSSNSFCLCVFMALIVYHQIFTGSSRRLLGLRVSAAFLAVVPAIYIALTRISDFRHHWEDVTVGALIGTFFAVTIYRVYYPKGDIVTAAFQVKEWEKSETDPLRLEP